MNDLEKALAGNDDGVGDYLQDVPIVDFRKHVQEIIIKRESPDLKSFKEKLKAAIDAV